MKITRKEKSQLILEGLVTIGLIGLLYYAAFVILSRVVLAFPEIIRSLWIFGDAIISIQSNQVISITPFFGFILFIIDFEENILIFPTEQISILRQSNSLS